MQSPSPKAGSQASAAYLFGDSTPFPIAENFLETACAASRTAVLLFRADETRVEERRRVAEIDERTEIELAHFEHFANGVENTYANPHDELREQIRGSARTMTAGLHEEILKWRETATTKALETAALSTVLPAIGAFFEPCQLPGTEWRLAWGTHLEGKGTSFAQVHGRAPGELDVSFDVAIPLEHRWARPARVSTIAESVSVRLLKKRVLRQPRVELESLDSLYVTEVIDLPGESSLTLRRSSKNPSPGLRVVLMDGGHEVHVARIGADGARTSEPEVLTGEDDALLRRFFATVCAELQTLVVHRKRVRAAYFRGVAVHEVEQPAAIGALVIASIAPYLREIARRSNGRNELVLKRTLGDGRREELYVSYGAVLDGVDKLATDHRALFAVLGLRNPAARLLPPARQVSRLPMPSDAEMTRQRQLPPLRAAG